VLWGKLDTSQNKGTSLWNFAPHSGLRKFSHGKSILLSTKLVDGRACISHVWSAAAVDGDDG